MTPLTLPLAPFVARTKALGLGASDVQKALGTDESSPYRWFKDPDRRVRTGTATRWDEWLTRLEADPVEQRKAALRLQLAELETSHE